MRQRTHHLATALLLAWLIVVQSVAGSVAAAQPMLLDAFGNPLCINKSVSEKAPGHDKRSPLDCCMVGCCAASFAKPPAPEEIVLVIEFRSAPAILAAAHMPSRDRQSRHEPGNPRAPPALV